MPRPPDLLDTTERIAGLLVGQGIQALVIGAAAKAAHRYVRHTEDIDLGVNVPVPELATVAGSLRAADLRGLNAVSAKKQAVAAKAGRSFLQSAMLPASVLVRLPVCPSESPALCPA